MFNDEYTEAARGASAQGGNGSERCTGHHENWVSTKAAGHQLHHKIVKLSLNHT